MNEPGQPTSTKENQNPAAEGVEIIAEKAKSALEELALLPALILDLQEQLLQLQQENARLRQQLEVLQTKEEVEETELEALTREFDNLHLAFGSVIIPNTQLCEKFCKQKDIPQLTIFEECLTFCGRDLAIGQALTNCIERTLQGKPSKFIYFPKSLINQYNFSHRGLVEFIRSNIQDLRIVFVTDYQKPLRENCGSHVIWDETQKFEQQKWYTE